MNKVECSDSFERAIAKQGCIYEIDGVFYMIVPLPGSKNLLANLNGGSFRSSSTSIVKIQEELDASGAKLVRKPVTLTPVINN